MAKDNLKVAPVPGIGYPEHSKKERGSMFAMIPLLGVSLILYTGAGVVIGDGWQDNVLLQLTMVSEDVWVITFGHAFLILSMVFLFVELLRGTNTGTVGIVNNGLSAVLFIIGLFLFLLVQGFGNSIFFIFLAMTFLDFMAGFIVSTVTARRDFGVAT